MLRTAPLWVHLGRPLARPRTTNPKYQIATVRGIVGAGNPGCFARTMAIAACGRLRRRRPHARPRADGARWIIAPRASSRYPVSLAKANKAPHHCRLRLRTHETRTLTVLSTG